MGNRGIVILIVIRFIVVTVTSSTYYNAVSLHEQRAFFVTLSQEWRDFLLTVVSVRLVACLVAC